MCRNRGVGRELVRALAVGGTPWIGLEPTTPGELARDLVALDLAREGLAPVDDLDQRALLDEAIDETVGAEGEDALASLAEGVGFRDAVANAVLALRLAGVPPRELSAAAIADPARRRLLRAVLSGYTGRLDEEGRIDPAGILARAIARLEEGAPLPAGRVLLMADLPTRGLAGRWVRLLAEGGAGVLPMDPVTGLDPPPIVGEPAAKGSASRLSWLHAVDDALDGDEPEIEIFAAADPEAELREVLRRVVASGRSWDEVEIVAVDPVAYGCALDSLATRLGVPVTYAVGLPIDRTRQGRAAAAYLEWIQTGFPAEIVRQLLEIGDMRPPGGEAPTGGRLARRLRRLRVGWSRERYLEAIDRRLAALAREAAARDEDDPDPEEIRERREREREEVEHLRELVMPILDATPGVPDRLGRSGSPVSPAALARGLLVFLAHVPAGPGLEEEAQTRLAERLEAIARRLTRPTAFGPAAAILREHLAIRVPSPGAAGPLPWSSAGTALHFADLDHGGWTGRPMTFLVGLDAERFPGAGLQDPILLDEARRRIDPEALPSSIDRLHERRWALTALLARLRGVVTLSYAAWDASEARDRAPAAEVLQSFRLAVGDPAADYEALRAAVRPLASAVPRGGTRLDTADVWLGALEEDGILKAGLPQVRAAHAGLDRGIAARDARESPAFTPHDGRIDPRPDELDPRRNPERTVSATALESLGACPLRYLHQAVLGLRTPDDPELDPDRWLDPLRRGSLLHDVYEATLKRADERGLDPADEAFEALAREILAEQIERYRVRVPFPSDVVYRNEAEELERDLRWFVEMVREDGGATWLDFEVAFGYGDAADGPLPIGLGGATIHARGRIDRVDDLPDGRLRIVDYKTGKPYGFTPEEGVYRGGRRLQHVLYTKAAAAIYERAVARMEYHFPTEKGEKEVKRFDVVELADGERLLGLLFDIVASGMFVPTEEAGDCKFCDYHPVCRVDPGEYFNPDSPPAEWAKGAFGTESFVPLRRVRGIEGGGAS